MIGCEALEIGGLQRRGHGGARLFLAQRLC